MRVTEIKEISKTKCKVYTDEEITLVLYKGDLYKYKIAVDQEISDEVYHYIRTELYPKRSFDRCMKMIQTKDYTEYEVRCKLSKDGYPEDVIDGTVNKLYEYRFLNDDYYARCYIENRMKRKSKREIARELSMKGISQDKIETLFNEIDSENDYNSEKDAICNILRKKHFDCEKASYEDCIKMKNYLFRKGFNSDYVNELVRNNYLT